MSPVYGQEVGYRSEKGIVELEFSSQIFTAVVDRMNDLRARFLRHNPNFNGKVSIIGHSLGAVIAYDIVQRHSPCASSMVCGVSCDRRNETSF
jgi:alpha-beta hydrolase superfamily lysophospholipase